ncbi:MAG: hypothetical protein E7C50_00240 [Clostridium sp.]|uniref:hypothetical protein n=1 Tax=Clostridium sp. TaxID=1506 RepID=UPI0029010EE2|nr:hypothetical protein [Clostridium sp.]MDU2674009.1 hypothetical protein [Clostridium sp.]MDU2680287.1 hypothetical protein [Clostridium sp.]
MKKFIALFLILIFFIPTTYISIPAFTKNIFKEGIYKSSDFNFSENETYFVQNVSSDNSVFLTIYDENQIVIQSIRLKPNSNRYDLIPLKPDYRIVIVGNGEVFIDPKAH